MIYSAKQRKMICQQLKGAKKYLWDGKGKRDKDEFICIAVTTHVLRTNSKHGWSTTTNMIQSRLDDKNKFQMRTVRDWLIDVAKIPVKDLTDEKIQTYRHEWLDHLIEEFSK